MHPTRFLATKLGFANAMAALCEAVGADVDQVLYGMGLDSRIGLDFLQPGPGWGGSCLPKDAAALVCMAADAGYDFSLLKAVIAANEQQHRWVVEKIIRVVGGSLTGHSVGLLGLTFKAGTDDFRGSPALAIAAKLCDGGAKVTAYDPTVDVSNPPECCTSLRLALARGAYEAADGTDVLVIATDWPELRSLCPRRLRVWCVSVPSLIPVIASIPGRGVKLASFMREWAEHEESVIGTGITTH